MLFKEIVVFRSYMITKTRYQKLQKILYQLTIQGLITIIIYEYILLKKNFFLCILVVGLLLSYHNYIDLPHHDNDFIIVNDFLLRNDAQSKMLTLKEKSDKDLVQYGIELKELMRIIDHDRKLREFMNAKAEDRSFNKNDDYINQVKENRNKAFDTETIIQVYFLPLQNLSLLIYIINSTLNLCSLKLKNRNKLM